MKRCPKCGEVKDRAEYQSNRARSDGLQRICADCQRAYVRDHYLRNRDYYLAKAQKSNRAHAARDRSLPRELKSRPCLDCGRSYPAWVMEFDHVTGQKLFSLGTELRNRRADMLLAEAAKCEVVCSNCHRDRTYRRLHARP